MNEDVEAKDRLILELLASDGRMSYTDLGRATGLSTSAVHQRVKRLEQRGLILGYGATVNHDELGLPTTAFVALTLIDPLRPDDYAEKLRHFPEIESCWSVAGEESYILKVRTSTPAELEGLLFRVRQTAHVSTRTTIVLSTYYENRPVAHSEIALRADARAAAASEASASAAQSDSGEQPPA
jgi:Lrp/AsnC family leucine-responsive transcriptional regulator